MYKITDKLYVGRVSSLELAKGLGFSILGACKYPLHQQNARLKVASKDGYLKINPQEPEYFFAKRNHALYLNLVDGNDPKHISDEMIDEAIKFIYNEMWSGRSVFVTCNQAESRSPSIAFMYLIDTGFFDNLTDFDSAYRRFKNLYPLYVPRIGMLEYTKQYFNKHRKGEING